MDIQSQIFLDFCTRPEVAALIDDPRPAWIFSDRGTDFLWANAAGAKLFSARTMTELLELRLHTPVHRLVSEVAQTGSETSYIAEDLRFFIGFKNTWLRCHLKKVALRRRPGAAMVVADATPVTIDIDPLSDFCDLLAAEHTAALIFDTDGNVRANAGFPNHVQPALTGIDKTEQPVFSHLPSGPIEDVLELNTVKVPAVIAKTQSEDHGYVVAIVDTTAFTNAPARGGSELPGDKSDARALPSQSAPLLIDPENMRILPARESPERAMDETSAPGTSAEQSIPDDIQSSSSETPLPSTSSGQFEPASHPTQFVWQMNIEEEFTFLSPEFSKVMNVPTNEIVGRSWQEVRKSFDLDKEGVVARALRGRDTWSGITIDWPVNQERLLCPVDLAALPAIGHNGDFEGYRGFGVCHTDRVRSADSGDSAPVPTPVSVKKATESPAEKNGVHTQENAAAETKEKPPEIKIEQSKLAAPKPADPARTADQRQAEPSKSIPDTIEKPERNIPDRRSQVDSGESLPESIQLAKSDHNVVRIVTAPSRNPVPTESDNLSKPEKDAFRKIAEALGARLSEDAPSIDAEESDGAIPNTAEAQPDTDNRTQTELATDDTQEPHGSPSHTLSDSAEPASGAIDPRILDRLPIGVAIVHLRDVLYCNDTMLELLGYQSISELSDAGGLEAIFAEPEEWPDTDEETQETDQSVCVRMKNGNLKRVDARLHTVPWQGGNGLMISLHELTDQNLPVQTEQPTVEFEEISEETVRVAELESILETATDGIIIMTADGIVQAVNRSAEALFGRNGEELIGGELAACLAPESRRSIRDYIGGLTQNGVASLLNDGREVIGIAEGGGMIPLFMTIGRINTEGDDIKLCAVLRDITQWKKAEEELTSASREAELASSQKSDFLAKISHEIRTPLNAIIGFSEVMMEERFGPIGNERYREYLLDIHNSGAHIMSLINDLLDLSKIEAGKLELTFESVSVNEIIRECVALMQPQANRDRIIIRASLPTSTPNVVADARSLRQIILNLLSNAIKFNNPGGQVIISTVLESNGELFIRVRDTGIGMNKKDLKLALEPFRQLHTARLGGGTGLGLPLTKALAEANRAMFNLESETGEGTLVEIAFPAQRVLVQ